MSRQLLYTHLILRILRGINILQNLFRRVFCLIVKINYQQPIFTRSPASASGPLHSRMLNQNKLCQDNGLFPRDASRTGMNPLLRLRATRSVPPSWCFQKVFKGWRPQFRIATTSQSWFTDASSLAFRPMAQVLFHANSSRIFFTRSKLYFPQVQITFSLTTEGEMLHDQKILTSCSYDDPLLELRRRLRHLQVPWAIYTVRQLQQLFTVITLHNLR